jgi:PleD family two-component response regulator
MVEAQHAPQLKPLRVLIIEDYEEDALLLRRHLSRAGYAVDALRIETSEELRAALAEAKPWDMVLADYTLPSFGARDRPAVHHCFGHDR